MQAQPNLEKSLEHVRQKEYNESLPHYAELIDKNQKEYRDRLERADQRNIKIYSDAYKSGIKTKTLADKERDSLAEFALKKGNKSNKKPSQKSLNYFWVKSLNALCSKLIK